MPLILLAAAAAVPPSPACSVSDRAIVGSLREMPPSIREALGGRMADRDQPFNISDAVPPGQERWPFLRVICGYKTATGYVVERERGGRAYSKGRIVFANSPAGYVEAPAATTFPHPASATGTADKHLAIAAGER